MLAVRHEHRRGRRLGDGVPAHVARHAHDRLDRGEFSVVARHDGASNRIFPGEVPLGERAVDDDDAGTRKPLIVQLVVGQPIGVGEVAAAPDRDAHGAEVASADNGEIGSPAIVRNPRAASGRRRRALGAPHRTTEAIAGQRHIRDETNGLDAGHGADFLQQLVNGALDARPRTDARRGRKQPANRPPRRDVQDLLRLEPEIDTAQLHERPQEQQGARQQEYDDRHFPPISNRRIVTPRAVAARARPGAGRRLDRRVPPAPQARAR